MTRAATQTEVELTGRVMLPDVVILFLGLYRLLREWSDVVSWHTYFLIVAAIITAVSTVAFAKMIFGPAAHKPSFLSAMIAYSMLTPYALAFYVFFYQGVGSLVWMMSDGYRTNQLLYGLFWAFVGYRLLHATYVLSELANKRD